MITVSDKDKCVCVWGNPEHSNLGLISEYQSRGYIIVRLSNGTSNIRDCIKEVAKSDAYT